VVIVVVSRIEDGSEIARIAFRGERVTVGPGLSSRTDAWREPTSHSYVSGSLDDATVQAIWRRVERGAGCGEVDGYHWEVTGE
jgi:hypothetical protein